jgi:hypothetical protein
MHLTSKRSITIQFTGQTRQNYAFYLSKARKLCSLPDKRFETMHFASQTFKNFVFYLLNIPKLRNLPAKRSITMVNPHVETKIFMSCINAIPYVPVP